MLSPGCHRLREVIARALHEPGQGYYSQHIRAIGRHGDFSTSATTGRSLAQAVARWAVEAAAATGVSHLIEVGAGDGSLAAGILSGLPWRHPLRRGYLVVDTSGPLREKQRQRLGKKVRWFDDVNRALESCDGMALILGNELADAFPPTVVQWNGTDWEEVALDIGEDGVVREAMLPWRDTAVACAALEARAWPNGRIPDRQRVEWLESFQAWLAGWMPGWRRGACLWIDYGAPFPELYHRRPRGTLRAYYLHQRLEGMEVFRRLGRQDITCDVNFTDLQAWGEALGLATVACESQAAFLRRYDAVAPGDPAAGRDAGEAFRVLWQVRDAG